jgi:hypothetical protein
MILSFGYLILRQVLQHSRTVVAGAAAGLTGW